jgi:hypothetical protein
MKKPFARILVLTLGAAALAFVVADASAAALPNTAIHGGPTGTTTSRTASFHLLGTGGAVRIQCKLDRRAWYVCARTSSKSIVLRSLSRGSHTFLARAVNRAGKVDPTPARRTWRIR